jgi:mono/diheme cytochrome c family protein
MDLLLRLFCLPGLLLVAGGCSAGYAADATPAAEHLAFYESEVLPILTRHCYKCHGPGKAKGGLTLASRAAILKGGDSGPAVDLKTPSDSGLLQAVNYQGFEMPPAGKLPASQIATLTKWVELGLPMPAGDAPPVSEPAGAPRITDETKQHWSFRPVQRPEVPVVKNAAWVANPIDAFVLSKLEAAGLQPNPPAAPERLYRRVHYDLLGLPPSLEDVQRYAGHPSETAYRTLIQSLLDSPHHGEHYARYWLDLVRYAESNSFERDNPKPFVWRYRDYVIRFFNSGRPYDQFIREQLAGDELDDVTPETLIATGYYRLGLWDDEPADPELAFYDGIDDIVSTTGQAFLGLTLNCARCHDHKLDPIPQSDYYRFAAFFRNVRHYGQRSDESVYQASVRTIATPDEERAFQSQKQEWEQRVAELRKRLDEVEARIEPQLAGGERDDFKNDSQRLAVIRKHVGEFIARDEFETYARTRKTWTDLRNRPPRSAAQALCVKENGAHVPPTHLLVRGSPHVKGDVVEAGFPLVLSPPDPQIQAPPHRESSGRRRALAEWIASRDNPLTARVMVNRLWQWHFGRGLVPSANNFGLQGDPPTHPELLDWLAAEFMEHGWDLRHIHTLILTSNSYRMSSQGNPVALEKDPQNLLLWRFDMRRLRAEELRDSILAANGSLNLDKMFGPSIYPTIEAEVLAGQSRPGAGWEKSSPDDMRRRSIYIHIKRSLTVPLLANFDVADTDFTCPVRFATTQPTQALTLLNSVFLQEQSRELANDVQRHGSEPRRQVAAALQRVLQREPNEAEIRRGLELVESLQRDHGETADAAMQHFCLLALNLNEFVYLD